MSIKNLSNTYQQYLKNPDSPASVHRELLNVAQALLTEDIPHRLIDKTIIDILIMNAKSANFDMEKASSAFGYLEEYAVLLFRFPWKREYWTIKHHCGFYRTMLDPCLQGADKILNKFGYRAVNGDSFQLLTQPDLNCLLEIAIQCLLAHCEYKIVMKACQTAQSTDFETALLQHLETGGTSKQLAIKLKTDQQEKLPIDTEQDLNLSDLTVLDDYSMGLQENLLLDHYSRQIPDRQLGDLCSRHVPDRQPAADLYSTPRVPDRLLGDNYTTARIPDQQLGGNYTTATQVSDRLLGDNYTALVPERLLDDHCTGRVPDRLLGDIYNVPVPNRQLGDFKTLRTTHSKPPLTNPYATTGKITRQQIANHYSSDVTCPQLTQKIHRNSAPIFLPTESCGDAYLLNTSTKNCCSDATPLYNNLLQRGPTDTPPSPTNYMAPRMYESCTDTVNSAYGTDSTYGDSAYGDSMHGSLYEAPYPPNYSLSLRRPREPMEHSLGKQYEEYNGYSKVLERTTPPPQSSTAVPAAEYNPKIEPRVPSDPLSSLTDWDCHKCTYRNPNRLSICYLCSSSRHPTPTTSSLEMLHKQSGERICEKCTLKNAVTARQCSACGHLFKGYHTAV